MAPSRSDAWHTKQASTSDEKGEKPADLPVMQPTQVRAGDQPQDRQDPRPDHFRPASLRFRPTRWSIEGPTTSENWHI